jgi:hypothetical protein
MKLTFYDEPTQSPLPALDSLGPLYAASRTGIDVYGPLANGYGPNSAGFVPQQPAIATPTGQVYYVSNSTSNGFVLGVDTNAGTTKGAPFLTITGAIAAAFTAFPGGNVLILVNSGTYSTYTGGGTTRIVLAGTFASYISVEPYSGQLGDVIFTDSLGASGNAGVIEVRGASSSFIQFRKIVIQSSGIANNFYLFLYNPTSSAITTNNIQFAQCQFDCVTNSTAQMIAFAFSIGATDAPMNGFNVILCTFLATGSGTKTPNVFQALPLTMATTNQPYNNLGFWSNQTVGTWFDFCTTAYGINGFTAIGNIFTFLNHGMMLGSDTTGNQGGSPVPQCTNVYIGGNYFSGTTGLGHGMVIGNAVNQAVVEYNYVLGTIQGIVVKSSNGTASVNAVIRRNYVLGSGSGFVGSGLQAKACTYAQFLENIVYVQSAAAAGTVFEEEYDNTVPSIKAGNTTLQGNYLIADGANVTLLNWNGSTESTGGGVADYNVYEARNGAGWGNVRGTSVSSVGTTNAAWGSAGLTGDNPKNDANSQSNNAGGRADVSYTGAVSTNYYAEYVNGYGQRFGGLIDENYNPATEYRYAFFLKSTATATIYTTPNPFNLPAGNYTVSIRQMLGLTPASSDPVVSQQALSYAGP